jgi:hypothetical protein
MTDLMDDLQTEPGVEPDAPDLPGDTVIDGLRAQREAIGKDTDTILEVSGYNGALGAQFQLLPFREYNQRMRKAQQVSGEAELNLAAEVLAEACLQIVVNDPDHPDCLEDHEGKKLPWRPIDPGRITRFDDHLAELLQIQLPGGSGPREVVRLAINRDFAVVAMFNQLAGWMGQSNAEANERFQGE